MKRKTLLLMFVAAVLLLLAWPYDVRAWYAYRYGYRAGGVGYNPYYYGGYRYGTYGGYRYGYVRRW
jgi:hypothetical protein